MKTYTYFIILKLDTILFSKNKYLLSGKVHIYLFLFRNNLLILNNKKSQMDTKFSLLIMFVKNINY